MDFGGGVGSSESGCFGGEGLSEPGLAHFTVEEVNELRIGWRCFSLPGFYELNVNGAAEHRGGICSE